MSVCERLMCDSKMMIPKVTVVLDGGLGAVVPCFCQLKSRGKQLLPRQFEAELGMP